MASPWVPRPSRSKPLIFAKKSFEHGTSTLEKLVGAKSLDKAIEIQTDYVKSSYEAMVAQSSKFGELYSNLAKEMVKPVETVMAKTASKVSSLPSRRVSRQDDREARRLAMNNEDVDPAWPLPSRDFP